MGNTGSYLFGYGDIPLKKDVQAFFGCVSTDGFDFIEFSVPGIVEIRFSQIHDAAGDRELGLGLEGYLPDDISFDFTLIREPSAALLVGLGLMGLSRAGRRPV